MKENEHASRPWKLPTISIQEEKLVHKPKRLKRPHFPSNETRVTSSRIRKNDLVHPQHTYAALMLPHLHVCIVFMYPLHVDVVNLPTQRGSTEITSVYMYTFFKFYDVCLQWMQSELNSNPALHPY